MPRKRAMIRRMTARGKRESGPMGSPATGLMLRPKGAVLLHRSYMKPVRSWRSRYASEERWHGCIRRGGDVLVCLEYTLGPFGHCCCAAMEGNCWNLGSMTNVPDLGLQPSASSLLFAMIPICVRESHPTHCCIRSFDLSSHLLRRPFGKELCQSTIPR